MSLAALPSSRSHRAHLRAGLTSLLEPGRRTSLHENVVSATALFVAGLALALFRLNPGEALHSLWAEDGGVFLRGAELNSWFTTAFRPYGGYMHMFPRVIAGIASLFPLADGSAVMNILQALVHAGCAVFTYFCLRGYIQNRALRIAAPIAVCAATVGAETADFTGGLQFMVLPVAAIAVLWSPRSRLTRGFACVFLYAACASTPFGAIPTLLFALRLYAERTRGSAALFAAAAAGSLTQGVVMATTSRQSGLGLSSNLKPGVADMVERYTTHIAGQVPVGDRIANTMSFAHLRTIGYCVTFVVVASMIFAAISRRDARGYLPILVLGVSAVLFAVPVYLNAPPLTSAIFSSRYDLPGGIAFVVALSLVVDVLVGDLESRALKPWRRSGEGLAAVLCGLVMAAFVLATVDNIQNAYASDRTQNWSASVATARRSCEGQPGSHIVRIQEDPAWWSVRLPCRAIG